MSEYYINVTVRIEKEYKEKYAAFLDWGLLQITDGVLLEPSYVTPSGTHSTAIKMSHAAYLHIQEIKKRRGWTVSDIVKKALYIIEQSVVKKDVSIDIIRQTKIP